MSEYKNEAELQFEREVIDFICNIGGSKQWEYRPDIKTTEALWDNFKNILEMNNSGRLKNKLSSTEFAQVRETITKLDTPYKAGQFLYGVNGVSQVDVDLDDGSHVVLTIFDQAKVGCGNTFYQIVNQIERPKILDGKPNRRFDVTLLINGLPILQIELKSAMHRVNEALNQIHQYIAEKQYSDIYSTVQVLIAMSPYEIKYMANTTQDKFNKSFAFDWQDEKAVVIRNWKEFSNRVLSIPMAHDLATQFMILDGTKNKECIKVMRPYQVYATKSVLDKVRKYDFNYMDGRLGYIWHTTGSGKTITSFKTAWLISRMPNVDKVVFLVDRIALTNQTRDAYIAYDPVATPDGKTGVVTDTANVSDLKNKITQKSDKNIIVTSIQKMSRFVINEDIKNLNQNIVFIVDEAHRSTGDGTETDGMLNSIKKACPNAAWIGYTGTPKFPSTQEIFGDPLHIYTIKEAIADKNVLGFNVEFKETIKVPENLSEDEMDDNIKSSAYDTSEEHVKLVVKDILDNWKQRSNNKMFNAMLTVHVGGNKASTPRAMEYYREFKKQNLLLNPEDRITVAVSFSFDTSNSDYQLTNNNNLSEAMEDYANLFGCKYGLDQTKQYTEDVVRRLNKTADDGKYLDLVIVVDQLLTGFDAPGLNTLYVDRTLNGSSLIQAYSRTNRIYGPEKPNGIIINYRWPKQNEYKMNKAFAIYSNRQSANKQTTIEDLGCLKKGNIDDGILVKTFNNMIIDAKELVDKLRKITKNFTDLPDSERLQEEMIVDLKEYSKLITQLKQYTLDDNGESVSIKDNPNILYDKIGISEDQEVILTSVLAGYLRDAMADQQKVDISKVDFKISHIHDVRINYDYLVELIAKMADEINEDKLDDAAETEKEIDIEISKSDSEVEKTKIKRFIKLLKKKEYVFDSYPAPRITEQMYDAMNKAQKEANIRLIREFITNWGLDNSTTFNNIYDLISKHTIGQDDLDKQGEVTEIMNKAKDDYKDFASEDIRNLSWIKFRNNFRKAIFELADKIKKGEL